MLSPLEEIQQKTDGFLRNDGTYFDKHNFHADGKAYQNTISPRFCED